MGHMSHCDFVEHGKTLAEKLRAFSRPLCRKRKMWFIGTPKMGTNALSQLLSRKQSVRFHHSTLAMHPLGPGRVEPGTFGRQKARQDTDAGSG
jgi:hypothetical protein